MAFMRADAPPRPRAYLSTSGLVRRALCNGSHWQKHISDARMVHGAPWCTFACMRASLRDHRTCTPACWWVCLDSTRHGGHRGCAIRATRCLGMRPTPAMPCDVLCAVRALLPAIRPYCAGQGRPSHFQSAVQRDQQQWECAAQLRAHPSTGAPACVRHNEHRPRVAAGLEAPCMCGYACWQAAVGIIMHCYG
jgi:hypothetical protein